MDEEEEEGEVQGADEVAVFCNAEEEEEQHQQEAGEEEEEEEGAGTWARGQSR